MSSNPMKKTEQTSRWRLPFVAALAVLGTAGAWYTRRRLLLPIQTETVAVPTGEAMPHPIPPEAQWGEAPLQLLTSGFGPLFIRAYQVDIANPKLTPEAVMHAIVADLNNFTPGEMASFEKINGQPDQMKVGDEYEAHVVGPWNGPVRVINVTPTAFSFVTLRDHFEAGEITFSVREHPEKADVLRFRIQSWARSSNRLTDFFYRVLGISRFAQTTMWASFCAEVVSISGGEMLDSIQVMTHQMDAHPLLQALPGWKRYSTYLDRWRGAQLNFDISKTEEFTEANGWRLDEYSIGLPSEAAGEPVPNGSFEAAKQVLLNYEFPDPALITGIFVPDDPLADRVMVLRARFLFMTFLFGARIGRVIDELRPTEKQGQARVWGYSYRTLEGHFEMGEITFEIWKFLESGEVQFRIHAYSHPDFIPNLAYRVGFRIFGRSLQVRFARTALTRMQQLVLERLSPAPAVQQPVETPEVLPLEADAEAQEKAEEAQDSSATSN